MTSFGQEWTVGHSLSQEEVERLESEVELDDLIAVATHPEPGGYFSEPYLGRNLRSAKNSRLFVFDPDLTEEELDGVVFIGEARTDDELINRAVDFIISGDHEVNAAAKLHFDEDAIESDAWLSAIPIFYWFRLGQPLVRLSRDLDNSLMSESKLYNFLAGFLDDPNGADFESFRNQISSETSFSSAYSLLKYGSEI